MCDEADKLFHFIFFCWILDDSFEYAILPNAEATERQLTNQDKLGGSLATTEPGCFEFVLNPYVDSHSKKMSIRERHYTSNIRQVELLYLNKTWQQQL